jgi:hypothetical protein
VWARFYLACSIFLEPARMNDSRVSIFMQRLFTDKESRDLVQRISLITSEANMSAYPRGFYWAEVAQVLTNVNPNYSMNL